MAGFEITRGKQMKALKVLIYGVEGVGKTTLAASFPDPVFIDCEGGTDSYDVARFPSPTSWEMLMQEVQQVIDNPAMCSTLVIDTIDWAEAKAIESVCRKHQVENIEDFGWSKGYTYLNEEIGKLLNKLSEVVNKGVNVVLTAHMAVRTITLPDDAGAYDRYELKLKTAKNGNNSQLVKEWADMVLFCNYRQFVVEDEKTKKKKATGGKERVMYTSRTSAYDAKNRFGLPDQLPLSFEPIAHLFASAPEKKAKDLFGAQNVEVKETPETPAKAPEAPMPPSIDSMWVPTPYSAEEQAEMQKYDPKLVDLMKANDVHANEIEWVASDQKGYMPKGQPLSEYPADFIQQWIIPFWGNIMQMITERRDSTLPF